MWDVTYTALGSTERTGGISTHTSRVGCDDNWEPKTNTKLISTHTSRVGCDHNLSETESATKISTHTSRVGCDVTLEINEAERFIFLLTHPVWDVTAIYSIFQSHYSHILQDGPIIHLELY